MRGSIFVDLNSEPRPEGYTAFHDEQLVHGLQEGSEEAYEALIFRFQQPVYNLAYRLVNDTGDASDIVQEVFLKVFRNVGQFRHDCSLKTWIYRITVNEAHNQRRWFLRHCAREIGLEEQAQGRNSIEKATTDPGQSPFDYVYDREKRVLVEEALSRINPTFRTAVVLRDITDLSYEEIAEVLQLSLGTVKSRIMRGREALRQELTGRLEPGPAFALIPKPAE